MNYIVEINSFYDWLETNPVSDSAINLWYALMHINNKAGWREEFAVAISTLELKTSLSKSSIIRARNTLQQYGRINFKSREGQQSAVYSMIVFRTDTQSDTQTVTQTERKAAHKPNANRTINKLKETKLNTISPEGDGKKMYWKIFVEIFNSFYLTTTQANVSESKKEKYNYQKKDWGCLEKIYDFLKARADSKNIEWNEDYMTESFNFFLTKAWDKDDWLRKNFSIPNVLSQFNQITKESSNGSNQKRNEEGNSKHAGGAAKLADALAKNIKSFGS